MSEEYDPELYFDLTEYRRLAEEGLSDKKIMEQMGYLSEQAFRTDKALALLKELKEGKQNG